MGSILLAGKRQLSPRAAMARLGVSWRNLARLVAPCRLSRQAAPAKVQAWRHEFGWREGPFDAALGALNWEAKRMKNEDRWFLGCTR